MRQLEPEIIVCEIRCTCATVCPNTDLAPTYPPPSAVCIDLAFCPGAASIDLLNLNNTVEQDLEAIKRQVNAEQAFPAFGVARRTDYPGRIRSDAQSTDRAGTVGACWEHHSSEAVIRSAVRSSSIGLHTRGDDLVPHTLTKMFCNTFEHLRSLSLLHWLVNL
jgi:hypothetical protein